MIVLDTNVVSALLRPEHETAVMAWLDAQRENELFISSVTIFELTFGVEKLPAGRKKEKLARDLDVVIREFFDDRTLSLDAAAAKAAATLRARREREGKPIDAADTMIAGIAVSRNAAIATRNVRHFDDLDVKVINPWAAP